MFKNISLAIAFAVCVLVNANLFAQHGGHYHYHPSTVITHGNHLHVQPSHYDYHTNSSPVVISGGHTHVTPNVVVPAYNGVGMTVVNPATNSGHVDFKVDGKSYHLDPGMQIELKSRPKYVVSFDRGLNHGPAEYTISDGEIYKFTTSVHGWDIVQHVHHHPQTIAGNVGPAPNVVPQPIALPPSVIVGKPVLADYQVNGIVRVLRDKSPLMSGAEQIGAVDGGKTLRVLAVSGNWVQLDTPWLNKSAWIRAELVQPINDDVAPPAN